jgi:hypothetical protein
MEDFKQAVLVQTIASAITSHRAVSDTWGMPNFILQNPQMLETLFGSKAYNIYQTFSEEDKKLAIAYFETNGKEANEIMGTSSWEEDGSTPNINFTKMAENTIIYPLVVQTVAEEVYKQFGPALVARIIQDFIEDPLKFEHEYNRSR